MFISLSQYRCTTVNSTATFNLKSRIPTNPETQNNPLTSRYAQTPKWYQFIPRSLIQRPWIKGLLPDEEPYNLERKALIISDEGGVGKTKSAAIAINYYISQNPELSVLLLVPKRLIEDWKKELKSVNKKIQHKIVTGTASRLMQIRSGKVYIVSKDSFRNKADSLFDSWKQYGGEKIFSLVVIDEAHKGKGDSEGENVENNVHVQFSGSKMYKSMSRLCKNYSLKNLAVTASPLSMKLRDITSLAKMIDVYPSYYQHIPTNLSDYSDSENAESDEESEFLFDWAEFLSKLGDITKSVSKNDCTETEIHDFLEETYTLFVNSGIEFPYHNQLVDALSGQVHEGWYDYDTRLSWIKELNPLSPFLTIIKRSDLGEKANDIFRKRITWTEFIQLHEEHKNRIIEKFPNPSTLSPEIRQVHEWPTNEGYDGIYGRYDNVNFNPPGDVSHEITEPRLKRIVDVIIPMDPVLSNNGDTNKGCLIFCTHPRTVEQISGWLDGRKIIEGKYQIKTTEVTGATENSEHILSSLGDKGSQLSNVYNVVIATSAVQEGISMNWASTVIHWALPYNPQTLEQRTWRLDRHKKPEDSPTFNTVYLVTNSESDRNLVRRINERATLTDIILGIQVDDAKWPREFDETKSCSEKLEREYDGEAESFFFAEAKEIARIWKLQTNSDSPEFFIRTEQQKQLIHSLFSIYNLPINTEQLLSNGNITFNEWSQEAKSTLKQLMHLAEDEDLSMLQKCYPKYGMKNLLFVDGFELEAQEEKGRRFAISLDLDGELIARLQRRQLEESDLIMGPRDSKKLLLYSIELQNPIANYQNDFTRLYSSCFAQYSKLFAIEFDDSDSIDTNLLTYSNDRISLISQLISADEIIEVNSVDANIIDMMEKSCAEFINNTLNLINQKQEKLENDYDQIDDKISRMRPDNPESVEAISRLERIMNAIGNKITRLEESKRNLTSNIGQYRPVLRYIQGVE